MQIHGLTALLIVQLRQFVSSHTKETLNEEQKYRPHNTNFYYQKQQIQSKLEASLSVLTPLLNPLFAKLYVTDMPQQWQQFANAAAADQLGISPIASTSLHPMNSLKYSTDDVSSNFVMHDKVLNRNSSHNGQTNSSSPIEYLPTIVTPFLDNIAHSVIGQVQQHVQLIKPGTKWCGDGNKARNYDDVGVLYKTDKCCRMHDKCPFYILARESRFDLYNDGLFTRSHCDCDAAFYNCLKKVNSPFSTGVGITYFNILKMKCFRLEYPIVMCSHMAGWISKHCIEYIVDMAKGKHWQWFDNHEF